MLGFIWLSIVRTTIFVLGLRISSVLKCIVAINRYTTLGLYATIVCMSMQLHVFHAPCLYLCIIMVHTYTCICVCFCVLSGFASMIAHVNTCLPFACFELSELALHNYIYNITVTRKVLTVSSL